LRLYPTATIGNRVALVDTILPRGGGIDGNSPVLIKAGSSVWWAVYSLHRREAFYGEDAHEFKPERWESLGDPGLATLFRIISVDSPFTPEI
jgi:cytochrome P450